MSSERFKIAISMREIADSIHGEVRDAISRDLLQFLDRCNFEVNLIPNGEGIATQIMDSAGIQGVILSGGNNISPLPGEQWKPKDVSEDRDRTERELLSYCIRKKLPVLAICRGFHMFNVFFSGKIVRDLQTLTGVNHVATNHPICLEERCFHFSRSRKEIRVNSFHQQGVTKETLSEKLQVLARCENVVEAAHHVNLPILGVQWHPERPGSDEELDKAIVEAFCNKYVGLW